MTSELDPEDYEATKKAVLVALTGTPNGVRRLPPAPSHLGREGKAWWRAVHQTFTIPEHHVGTLEQAAIALDRLVEARRVIEAEGAFVNDRFGQPREHPASIAERQLAVTHARLVREMGLDLTNAAPSVRLPSAWRGR